GHLDGIRKTFETQCATLAYRHLQTLDRRLAHEYLARSARGGDTGRLGDAATDVVAPVSRRGGGVDADADARCEAVLPSVFGEETLNLDSALERLGCGRERDEESVAFVLDLFARVTDEAP